MNCIDGVREAVGVRFHITPYVPVGAVKIKAAIEGLALQKPSLPIAALHRQVQVSAGLWATGSIL